MLIANADVDVIMQERELLAIGLQESLAQLRQQKVTQLKLSPIYC